MEYGLLDIVELIGALGFFIYGMKVMSEGIQKAAGNKLKTVLGTMTKNRYFGVLSGFLITALVQSSSATTVMTVSFVNAGLLSLIQSAGIMMGANIGTTITAWLVSTLGFKIKIVSLALPIIAVALPMMFTRKGNYRFWAEFMIGFALLFMGLDFLKHSVPDIKHNPEILAFLQGFTDWGYASYILFIGIGTLLTIIVQSSSASMTITLVLAAKGWIPFDIAAAMVLGENVGTTITAELASIVGNVHAKRSARIHSLFNIIGVGWMLLILPFFIQFIDFITVSLGFSSPMSFQSAGDISKLSPEQFKLRESAVTYGLSIFHTIFNVTNVVIMIGFAHKLVEITERTIKPKGEDDERYSLEYIGSGLMASVDLSLLEVKKEIVGFSNIIEKMMKLLEAALTETEAKPLAKKFKKIKKLEEITDNIEVEISQYLIRVSESELSEKSSIRIQSMLSIISDLEQAADLIAQMSRALERKANAKVWFSPEQRNSLLGIIGAVKEAVSEMQKNLKGSYDGIDISNAAKIEAQIDTLRSKLRKEHLKSIESGTYNIQAGLVFVDLITSSEKLGDHIYDVSKAASGDDN
ncbi:MAG: Na/Pi cotransporter family protein [Salibacteraceae bacterium]